MPQKKSPVLQETIVKIRELLDIPSDVSNLPTVRSLARQLCVSPVTVMRAVEKLKGEGLISSRWGKGLFKPENLPPSIGTVIPEVCKYEQTLHHFKKDVSKGNFRHTSRFLR